MKKQMRYSPEVGGRCPAVARTPGRVCVAVGGQGIWNRQHRRSVVLLKRCVNGYDKLRLIKVIEAVSESPPPAARRETNSSRLIYF